MNPCNQIENVAAYALGCMEPAEKEQFGVHLAGCQTCQAELGVYQSVVDELAQAVPQIKPPPGLRHRILQQAVTQPNPVPKQITFISRLGQFFQSRQPALGIVSLVLLAALVFSNLFLLQQNNQLEKTQPKPFQLVMLHSPDPKNDSNAVMVISDDGQFGTLVTDNLAVLTNQQEYQLWLVKDGKRTSGGLFTVNQAGYGWLKIDSKISLLEYQSFGVTIEPMGGSPGPTGTKVLGS